MSSLEIKIGPYQDLLRPREGLHLIVELYDGNDAPVTAGIPLDALRDALATLPPPPGPTTVQEWNDRARARRAALKENLGIQGLKCSACGGVLVDTHPSVVFASNPPKKRLDCQDCQNIEYVYV